MSYIKITFYILITLILSIFFTFCNDKIVPPIEEEKGFLAEAGPILIISHKSGRPQLYSMNEDGSNINQLTNDVEFPIFDARWSPDGTKITLLGGVRDSISPYFLRKYIFTINADGTNKRQVNFISPYEFGQPNSPVWSPDSKKIIYTRDDGKLYLIELNDLNEKEIRPLAETKNFNRKCSDWIGIYLICTKDDLSAKDSLTGKATLYQSVEIMDKEGNIINTFGKIGEKWTNPKWGKDTQEFYYSFTKVSEQSRWKLIKFNISTNSQLPLIEVENSDIYLQAVSEKKILINKFIRNNNEYKIIVTNNDGGSVLDLTPDCLDYVWATSLRI